jgi:hypothetical protein
MNDDGQAIMQTDVATPTRHGLDWQMHYISRIGLPPLRFQGRLLDWQDSVGTEARLFIGLFLRKSGGYTVAICRITDCGIWAAHGFTTDTIEAAITAVEAYCADIHDEVALAGPSLSSPIDALSSQMVRQGRLADEVARFQLLVGHALDRWTLLTGNDSPPQGKGRK